MKNTKYVMIGGYAFSENSEMKKLKKLAQKGWILDGVSSPILSYRFIKGEPQCLDFAVDYQSEVDEEYFAFFDSKGWEHEATIGDEIHIFSAPENTRPIYTDRTSEFDKLETMREKFKYPSLFSLIIFAAMMLLDIIAPQEGLLYYVTEGVTIIAVIAFVFTGMPFICFQFRLRKFKKHNVKKIM